MNLTVGWGSIPIAFRYQISIFNGTYGSILGCGAVKTRRHFDAAQERNKRTHPQALYFITSFPCGCGRSSSRRQKVPLI
ncbi:unnamed protein product [Citrullus colocynthis]|uniref:Uncharacterized protein n=1 Tax=Citrullus colocynthis TaxID=252529 RepID=A0ABP0XX93_9ROSI